jgi:16S rRNA (cytidine1402-2'-O)-methyltransferase
MSAASLYIVATPIGNLQDMSLRAIEVLSQVDLIAAEDTRHSSRLLKHYGITTPLMALHEHNEQARIEHCLQNLNEGKSIALITDAGTPLISDPGFQLVRAARQSGLIVSPIPGPSAITAALSSAGLPSDSFIFAGFIPAKQAARLKKLEGYSGERRTMIFYEAPHRIVETLHDMQRVFSPKRRAVLAREMTKTHETFLACTLENLLEIVTLDANQQRGEMVLLLEGESDKRSEDLNEVVVKPDKLMEILLEELPLKQASSLAAKISGLKKNSLYQIGLKLK